MKLYDNDSHRDTFTGLVYDLLSDDPTWDRANQIIGSYDSAPAVELPDTTMGGTYVNIEWLKRTEAELKKYKELAAHPQGGPGDDSIEIVKPAEGDPLIYLKPCRICGNTEIVYERYRHQAGERWRCWCTKCLACIDPGWAQDLFAVQDIWNQSPPGIPLTIINSGVYAKTKMVTMPGSCNECAFGRRYGCVGDVECRILWEYFTGNVKPPYKERPDICPLTELTSPSDDPLTLDELRKIAGEPVWVVTDRIKEWCIVHSHHSADVGGGGIIMTRRTAEKRTYPYADCGKTWLAYRRRTEEAIQT